MELKNAEQQKAYIAEKQISIVRSIVIVFASSTFFLLTNPFIHHQLAYILICVIWLYGAYVLLAKPYEKYPIFLASWFTYCSDAIFTTLWVYATGGLYSPYHVIFYTSIVAVAFRFNVRTTLFTSALYTICYFVLLAALGQLEGNESLAIVRTGFIFIIGFLTNYITQETLLQTQQKLLLKTLVDDAEENRVQLESSREALAKLNDALVLRNEIFQHAEENADVGSYAWYLKDDKLEYSDNLFRLLGCKPGDFVPTFPKYLEFMHPQEHDSARQQGEETFKNRNVEAVVRRMLLKNGETRFFRTTGRFITRNHEEIMIGTVQDVTKDVHLTETLNAKNLELEHNNNELSTFNYIASHDLQEPVRKIHTFSNLILQREKDSLSEGTRDYLTRITGSASRMQRLIEAFSNYSRIGSTALSFEMTDFNTVISEAINNLGEIVTDNGAQIKFKDLPVVKAVPFHMQQLFENLLSNAIKYRSKETAPLIEIKAEKVQSSTDDLIKEKSPDEFWKITVKDNGIGFDPQYAEKIFEVFQRLHSKEQYPGTGIGLAICKKIVLTHNGAIRALSKQGEGACFEIFLPA